MSNRNDGGTGQVARRRQVVVDATTSEQLDQEMATGLTAAGRRAIQFSKAIGEAGPSTAPMLTHILGLDQDRV